MSNPSRIGNETRVRSSLCLDNSQESGSARQENTFSSNLIRTDAQTNSQQRQGQAEDGSNLNTSNVDVQQQTSTTNTNSENSQESNSASSSQGNNRNVDQVDNDNIQTNTRPPGSTDASADRASSNQQDDGQPSNPSLEDKINRYNSDYKKSWFKKSVEKDIKKEIKQQLSELEKSKRPILDIERKKILNDAKSIINKSNKDSSGQERLNNKLKQNLSKYINKKLQDVDKLGPLGNGLKTSKDIQKFLFIKDKDTDNYNIDHGNLQKLLMECPTSCSITKDPDGKITINITIPLKVDSPVEYSNYYRMEGKNSLPATATPDQIEIAANEKLNERLALVKSTGDMLKRGFSFSIETKDDGYQITLRPESKTVTISVPAQTGQIPESQIPESQEINPFTDLFPGGIEANEEINQNQNLNRLREQLNNEAANLALHNKMTELGYAGSQENLVSIQDNSNKFAVSGNYNRFVRDTILVNKFSQLNSEEKKSYLGGMFQEIFSKLNDSATIRRSFEDDREFSHYGCKISELLVDYSELENTWQGKFLNNLPDEIKNLTLYEFEQKYTDLNPEDVDAADMYQRFMNAGSWLTGDEISWLHNALNPNDQIDLSLRNAQNDQNRYRFINESHWEPSVDGQSAEIIAGDGNCGISSVFAQYLLQNCPLQSNLSESQEINQDANE